MLTAAKLCTEALPARRRGGLIHYDGIFGGALVASLLTPFAPRTNAANDQARPACVDPLEEHIVAARGLVLHRDAIVLVPDVAVVYMHVMAGDVEAVRVEGGQVCEVFVTLETAAEALFAPPSHTFHIVAVKPSPPRDDARVSYNGVIQAVKHARPPRRVCKNHILHHEVLCPFHVYQVRPGSTATRRRGDERSEETEGEKKLNCVRNGEGGGLCGILDVDTVASLLEPSPPLHVAP